MKFESLDFEIRGHVATVALNRPPVNAMNRALRQDLVAAFDHIAESKDIRAVVLTARGKVFCAGADIKERAGMAYDVGEHTTLNRLVASVFYAIKDCPKPVICAVNGPAIGAGFVLVTCCDVLLAADHAEFSMPEVDRGLAGGVSFLQRHLGPSKTRSMLMLAQKISAQEMHRLGVVEKPLPLAELMPAALAMAGAIAEKSPLAIGVIKESCNVVEDLSLRDGYRYEQSLAVELGESDDAREARQAFAEKRKPKYTGR